MRWHQADHDIVTRGQLGLYGNVTPEQQAMVVAASRRVGDGAGAGRDLEMLGGTNWESQGAGAVSPIPGGASSVSTSTGQSSSSARARCSGICVVSSNGRGHGLH